MINGTRIVQSQYVGRMDDIRELVSELDELVGFPTFSYRICGIDNGKTLWQITGIVSEQDIERLNLNQDFVILK